MKCIRPVLAYGRINPEKGYVDTQPKFYRTKEEENIYKEEMLLPCRQCEGCAIARSQEMTCKLMLHFSTIPDYIPKCFITLTYREKDLPLNRSLNYFDVALFIKNLKQYLRRHKCKNEIQYIYCGEYGLKTFRPHYHIVLIGAGYNELETYLNKYNHHQSKTISRIWKKGYHVVTPVTEATLKYVAGYTKKKLVLLGDVNIRYSTACTLERIEKAKKKGLHSILNSNIQNNKSWRKYQEYTMSGGVLDFKSFVKEYNKEMEPYRFVEYKGRKHKNPEFPCGRCFKDKKGNYKELERVQLCYGLCKDYYYSYPTNIFKGHIQIGPYSFKIPSLFMKWLKKDYPEVYDNVRRNNVIFNKEHYKQYVDTPERREIEERAIKSRLRTFSGGRRVLDLMDEEEEKFLDEFE